MTVKALRKQFLAAIAMVVVAAVALSSSTYAWFASNTTVTATNMQVTATSSSSIVISNELPTKETGTITVAASDTEATSLTPTTHEGSDYTTYPVGLKYNNNPSNVSAATGLMEENKTALTFAPVETSGSGTYFKDYTVYIAANGGEVTTQDITISLLNSTVNTLPGATSVDFYYAAVTSTGTVTASSSTFVGTLNLAGLDAATNNATATKTSLKIGGDTGITIPEAGATSGNKAIAITMRVYIDGALKDTSDTTYIKNVDKAEIAGQTLEVQFVASAHQ